MVAVVAGNGLGLFNTSLNILGAAVGSFGQGTLGQAGGKAWVNASTGNLILRFTDEQLSGQGQDLFHTRTYNTLGTLNDGDVDGWRWEGERFLRLNGNAFAAGSTLTRTTGDGHEALYAWNGTRYQSTEGDGAHDFIQWDAQNNEWYWTDGSTRAVERYNGSSGLLVSVRDTSGTLITYGYHNGKLTSVTDSSGQALLMVYNAAGKLARVDTRSVSNGPLTQQVYYEYDSYGRLTRVSTDLTPDDNSIADGNVYATTYTYDGSSFRIASISQSDGSTASFTYVQVGSEFRVATVTDASGTTTFSYDLVNRRTGVRNLLGQEWGYFYDEKGQLTYVQSPNINGDIYYTGYQYDADGNVIRVTDTYGNAVSYAYDERGNRILERDPKGVTVARTYNAANQLLNEIRYSVPATWNAASGTWTEPPASSAQVTRYVYDYADRLRFVVSATGSVVEYTYEARGLRAQEIIYGANRYPVAGPADASALSESSLATWGAAQDRAKTRLTGFNYDYRGNLILRVAYANVDASGNWLLDSAAELTRYVYNAQGQLLQTLAGRGADRGTQVLLSSTTYDGMGRVLGQVDANGTRTTVYNGSQRSIAVTSASGLTVTQLYDTQGRLIAVQEAASGVVSRSTGYFYDAAGRLNMKQDATGVRTFMFYDQLGRLGAEVDGGGNVTRYTYNYNDQRISELRYATPADTSAWFNGSMVSVTLAQILPASNAADRLTQLSYDQAGRLVGSIDAAGTVTTYEYDGRGQLVRQQTGERIIRSFYDADGRQVGALDAEGYLRENVYNAAGQLQQTIRYAGLTNAALRTSGSLADLRPASGGLSTWNFYDLAGRQIGSVDEKGFVSETVYDEAGNTLKSIRYATAYTAALTITSSFASVRTAVHGGASQVSTVAYDDLGRVGKRTAVDGSITIFEYDSAGRLVRETSAAGTAEERSIRTRYDAFGQTIGKLLGEASGKITAGMSEAQVAAVYSQYGMTWSYDAAGRVASVTDALGNRTLSYYDNTGRLTRVINAVGEVSETRYNAFGDAVERTQLSNRLNAGTVASLGGGLQTAALDTLVAAIRNASLDSRTTQAYDTRGLLLTSIDAEGISTTNQYDQYGQLQRQIRVIAGDRKVTTAFGYNLRGERISQTRDAGGLNLTDSVAYDAFGRVIRTTDAAGFITSTDYQDNGRTVVVRDPLNQARRSEFDAFGRTLREVDALGHITQYSYDDTNRSITVTLPDGTRVITWKTRYGETLKTVDGKGAVTQYEYNREGQLTRTVDALGQVAEKRYDQAGRLSESVDARGIVTHLDYDAANRVIQRSVDPTGLNQRTTYVFDTAGRQIKVVEFAGTTSARTTDYTYDRKGQLTQTIVDPNGLQLSTRYGYDGVGNVLRISQGTVASPEQRVTDYVYNAAGQRRFTVDALGYVSERKYDAIGNVVEETRYANKLQGSRDSASLQRLGVNRLDNVEFVQGSDGLPAGWGRSLSLVNGTYEVGLSQPGLIPQELTPGDNVVRLFQPVRHENPDGYMEMSKAVSGVQAGHRYSFSVYTAAQGTTGWAFIYWVDATGNIMGFTPETSANQNLNEKGGGTSLADYKRLVATGVAPEGAVSAIVVIRKNNTLPGYGATQFLAAHPQFEEVALDGGDVSPWSRPLAKSADDRVTSYVYDAVGRQRFSVDALGYVSERKYDSAGKVIEETRYANKLQGPRDSTTLQKLGANWLDNVEFVQGSDGLPAGWGRSLHAVDGTYQVGLSQPGLIPKELTPGDNVVRLFQSVRHENPDGYMEMSKAVSGVQAGHRYSFSVYTAAQGTTGWAFIYWVDAAGNIMSFTPPTSANQNLNEKGGGTSLADYKRLVATGVAPEGAVSAIVVIRKNNTLPGYGATQFLAVRPQFEEVSVGSSEASAWTRPPIKASADDRVTSYVYDALGRQRFSVDALGYVSERKYDAAGNVIEETRYANKLQGPRDSTALQKLGVNRLDNVEFVQGSDGLPAGWGRSIHAVSGTYEVGLSQPGMIPQELTPGDNVVRLFQPVRQENPDGYMEMSKSVSGVQAGHRYSFSVYTAAQGTTGWAFIYWVDAAGNIMSFTPPTSANQNLNEKGGGTSLADYKRLVATGVAPEGAVSAIVVIRKNNTLPGYGATQFLAVRPQFEEVSVGGSEASVWSRPPIKASADDRVTSYVYDALGRQRFSVDALGYVSERKYDAAGNVIEETRYANKLQGPRDSTTLQKLGANWLDNVEFVQGSDGLPAGWGRSLHAVDGTYQVGLSQPGLIPKELTPGDNVVRLFQSVRHENPDGYMEMSKAVSGVQAGHRYSFSVYTAAQGTTGWAFIYWVDAAGNIMSFTPPTSANQNLNEKGGGTSLADYKRLVATGVAPEGAVSAIVVIRKNNTLQGYGATQLLAVHPQFEELAVGSSDASAWTRPPIVKSADDRVTSYVYDTLGRQRFSVDALGYINERKYDATGNVVEEVRYANKLQGPRDSASLQKLGVNRLDNVEFVQGSDGLPAGWGRSVHAVSGTYEVGLSQPGMIPQELTPGDNVVRLFQPVRHENPDGYMEMSKAVSGVQAGHRYSFSVYTAAQGTTGWAFIYWVDAAGNIMSFTPPTSANQNLNEKGGGTSLADYKRLVATGVAPEGAVSAIVVIRKNNTLPGYGATQFLAVHPQFEEVALAGSDASPWSRPLIKASADDRVTSYVYDALGRQRFSVDALGYVSERKYDAAGNVIEEIRYANKLQGSRDSTTLQKLGVNRLDNAQFVSGTNGFAENWGRSTHAVNATYQVRSDLKLDGVPLGDNLVRLYQDGRNASVEGYMEASKGVPGIQAGHRYSFSVYTASQGANAWAFIYWVDAAGNIMSFTQPSAADQNLNEKQGGSSLADYKRLVATGVAPEGAVSAIVVIRKDNTLFGFGSSQLLAVHPQFEEVPIGGNDASTWSRSLIINDSLDRVTRYTYDPVGQLKSVTDPLGYKESYTYDAFGNRTSLTNKNGQTWNYRYDQAGQLFEEITPSIWYSNIDSSGWGTGQSVSLVTRYGYDAFGSVISRSEGRLRDNPNSDPAQDNVSQARTSTFGYDALGRQVRITSPGWYDKATGQYQQNAGANTFQITTEVTYDGLGNAVRNRVRVNNTGVAANDFVDSYKAYDVLGQVRYEVDALKGVTAYEYDGFGQAVLTRRNALPLNAAVPASGYYQPGDFNASTAPFSPGNDRTIITRYDRLGRKTEVQQNVVSLYDFTGNVASSMTKDVAPVKAYSYNAFGQVTRETLLARDTAGNSVMEQISTVNYYDRVGQRVGTIDALGYYTRLEYTGSGKVSRQVEYATALSGWSEAAIPTAAASAKDRSVRLVYDAADRLVQTVRENATYWQQTFAPNAARATMTQVTGDVVVSRSTYDGVGNALTLTDALGNVTTTEYNALGQVVKVTEPARYAARDGATNPFENAVYASPTTVYGLNAFGQVVYERRDAGAGQAGQIQITRSLHDAAGHLIKEFDAAGSAQDFKVDVAGRRLEETREIHSVLTDWRYVSQTLRRTFTYDSLGQQLSTSDWYTENSVQKSTTNSVVYNRFGEVTAELLNGNYKASYAYNQIGNVIQQTNAQGVTSLFYDLTGKVSRSAQLGDLTTATDDRITYQRNDLLGRVLEQHLPAFEANVNADTLNNVGLTLTTPIIRQTSDRWGNVLSRIDPRGYVTTYAYDHNNQVLAETLPVTDILRENGTSYRASLVHEKRYDALGQLIEEADVVDGNVLRTRQHVYNQAGELVRDIDALGASRYYIQDAHGNRVGTQDPLGIVTFDNYDEMDRHVRHGILSKGQRVTLLTNQYDQAGRLYAEIDGTATVQETLTSTAQSNGLSTITGSAGNTRFTVFDERGNIVQTRTESNIQKSFVFNEVNRKVAEMDGLGNSLTWTYNESDYGRLTSHKDLGNRNYSYAYNAFGQVVAENADKAYVYYANGLLKSVSVTTGAQRNFVLGKKQYFNEQWQSIKTSTYAYDLVGNKVSDALTSLISWSSYVGQSDAGSVSTRQENRYRFDEAGRLADAHSLAGNLAYGTGTFTFETRYTNNKDHDKYYKNTFHYSIGTTTYINLSYKFDEFGNRRRVTMNSLKPNLWDLQEDNWFNYDLNDRAVVVDGFLENGAVVAGVQAGQGKGYTLSYDAAGRRVASERWTSASSGQALYERSEYAYNSLNQVESRSVRNVYRQSGANSNAATQSVSAAQLDLFNVYDDRGRVVTQTTYKSGVAQSSAYSVYRGDNQKISEVTYTYTNGVDRLAQANYFGEAGMIDAAGNQTRYRYATFNSSGAVTQSGDYQTVYVGYETYKSATLTATASNAYPGVTTYVYNDRGDLLHLSSNTRGTYRRFAVDGDARMVGAEDAYTAYAQIYLNYQNTSLANSGRLSQGVITDTLVPISADYPAHAPSSYVVNEGDTLESIAQVVWGDRSMWYLIADANGKDLSEALVVGSSLRIPNVVTSNRNDSTTFKPYNAAEVIGDTITPPTPPKPKKKKCGGVASIVMVVVAVVATVFTAGAAAFAMTAAAGTLTAGAAVGAGIAAVTSGVIAGGLGVGIAAFGIGAAVGSLASQSVGKAMGVVDKISWKQAAVAGLGGAIGAGITAVAAGANSTLSSALKAVQGSGSTWQQVAIAYGAQGVAGYTGSYIASRVVGLDTSFSWKDMAASAVGSIVGGSINQNSGFWNSTIRGQISAHTSAWMRDKWFGGDRPDYGQVAVDAFGNSLANYMLGRFKEEYADREVEKRERGERVRELLNQEKEEFEVLDRRFASGRGAMLASTDTGWMPQSGYDDYSRYGVEYDWFELRGEISRNGEDFRYVPPFWNTEVPGENTYSEYWSKMPRYEPGFFEGVESYIYNNGVFDRPDYKRDANFGRLSLQRYAMEGAVNVIVSGLVFADELSRDIGANYVLDPLIAHSGIGLVGGEILALGKASRMASTIPHFAGQAISEWFTLRPELRALEKTSGFDNAATVTGPSVVAGKVNSAAERTVLHSGEGYVFRGDTRSPEIIFEQGFRPLGESDDLLHYARTGEPSIFVSTSTSPNVGRDFAQQYGGGYVYTIRGQAHGIDVNATLRHDSPFAHEIEVAVPGGVRTEDVMGARAVDARGRFIGEFIRNHMYEEK